MTKRQRTIEGRRYRQVEQRGDFGRYADDKGDELWFREEVSSGLLEPRWRVRMRRGEPTTATLAVGLDDLPGWRLEVTLQEGEATIDPVRFVIEPADIEQPPSPATPVYRKLGGADFERAVQRDMQQDMIRQLFPPSWRSKVLQSRRYGRQPVSELELAEVAAAYVQACEDDPKRPTALLAERMGVSYHTAQGLKRKAAHSAKPPLLELAGQGRSGGRLTERARQLLAENPKVQQ